MTSGANATGPRARWDERYRDGDWADHPEPAEIMHRAGPWLPTEGWALDLACGAGRNALFLARRGLRVVAADLSVEGLRRAGRRARSAGLPVTPVHADAGDFALRPGCVRVAINVRFLLRSAFPLLRDALTPGGLLVFETFTVDEIEVLGGDLRRAYVLERGELLQAFSSFEVLHYEEGVLEVAEGERGLARLIARKTPDAGV